MSGECGGNWLTAAPPATAKGRHRHASRSRHSLHCDGRPPPAPRQRATRPRRRVVAPRVSCGGHSFATARLPSAEDRRSRLARRGPLPRTACADSSAPSRSARPRRRRPRLGSTAGLPPPPARPPTSTHLTARLRPSAGLPPSHALSARPFNRGISPSAQGRGRAKRGGGGGASPLPQAGEQRNGSEPV